MIKHELISVIKKLTKKYNDKCYTCARWVYVKQKGYCCNFDYEIRSADDDCIYLDIGKKKNNPIEKIHDHIMLHIEPFDESSPELQIIKILLTIFEIPWAYHDKLGNYLVENAEKFFE